MRVLVVEDEPHIAEAVTFLLEREGHEVTVSATAPEPGDAMRGYDLLVLDIMLPGRSGFDIARDAMALAERPKICVLTAKGQKGDRDRMMSMGVDAFVSKPFSNSELMETVRGLAAR
ncbi:response regulator transcription factor [Acuticoccus yangtzensis]|uniref:response regulator transcription factor n=1 Tax=Acuticoccus yangtzensis TaxID=1443441 RepID=UPI000949AE90|nr:response regulator transcription factor [Acuticoccus yangtzensis]ORE91210.1 alkaline phosphatase synthesis transcriptional regulatory protein PhoP [Stappia sp. 22II-S9-Z10]